MSKTQPSEKKRAPTALAENRLLTDTFSPVALVYTYQGGQRVRVKKVRKYDVLCRDVKAKEDRILRKIDMMFVINAETLDRVKQGITLDSSVKARNLRTPEKIADRPAVLTVDSLNRGCDRDVRVVMRSGHVLRGQLIEYSRYTMVLNIGGARVLVYRHGVLEYSVTPIC